MILGGIGMATSALGSIGSFIQAAKQNRAIKEAEREATKAVKEARKRLDVNVYETLAVPKLPYEEATKAALIQSAASTQALQEGDPRSLAAGVGVIQQSNLENLSNIRADKEQMMFGIDKMIAGEEGRLADMGYNLSLAEAQGAQGAAKYATESKQQALQQGFSGLGQAAGIAASMPALYGGMGANRVEGVQGKYGESGTFDYALRNIIGEDRFSEYNALQGADRDAWLVNNLEKNQLRQLRDLSQYSNQFAEMRSPYASFGLASNEATLLPYGGYGGLAGVNPITGTVQY